LAIRQTPPSVERTSELPQFVAVTQLRDQCSPPAVLEAEGHGVRPQAFDAYGIGFFGFDNRRPLL
jgi:hypothetical protein